MKSNLCSSQGYTTKTAKKFTRGDIVERRIKIREEENLYIEKVVFVSGAFQTECKEKELGDFYEAPFQTFKIIGNIHKNPELLK
ncbi:YopX family protein [Capnocytophaga canimorsus]|nr:YopX family protein [Capnocytophaga canimorsus]WGU69545.1 YopX family protein [Capnocytophaga canimorsus]WGU71648.1 YopX family protein [Capnocytophaga canimorsus]